MPGVGFVGLGRMGQAMAPRLIGTGFKLIVWNRSPEPAAELAAAGALVVDRPADVWQHTDMAITMLKDVAATRDVFAGSGGLLGGSGSGRLICDMATYSPADTLALATMANECGVNYVDAPVGGTVAPARSGQLVVFAGGRETDIARLEPAFAALAKRVFRIGQVGDGSRMKMVMNLVLTVYWEAIAEALAMAEGGGLDLGTVLDVLTETPAAIPILASKRELLLDLSEEVGFDILGVRKDMRAVMQCLDEVELSAPAAAATLEAVTEAAACSDFGNRDVTKLVAYRRHQTGRKDER